MAVPGFLKGKIQAPDILRVMWMWSLIGFAAFAPVLYDVFWPSHDGYDVRGYKLGRDFANVWLGARLTREGKLSHLYDFPSYMAEMRALFGHDYTQHNFSYPPTLLPLIFLFGLLPYFPGLAAWVASGIAALVATIRANGRVAASWHLPALMLFSPAFMINLIVGQNGCFTAACFLGGFYLCDSSPVFAGVLFGLLTIKPHLGLLIPFALLLRKKWKCIASAGVTTVALIGLTLLLWGVTPWHDYVTKGMSFQESLLELSQGYYRLMMPGIYADARVVMKFSIGFSVVLQILCGLWIFVLAMMNVWRDGFTARTVAMLAIATPLVMPYSFNYDLMIVSGAAIIYLATVEEMSVFAHLAFGALWALPSAIFELKNMVGVPFSSIILVSSFLILHARGDKVRLATIRLPIKRLWVWTVIGLTWFAGPFIRFYLPKSGLLDVNGNIIGDDFVNVWFGSKLALAGKTDTLYNPDAYSSAMAGFFHTPLNKHNFSYFPNILPLILPFGFLPYFAGLAAWTAGGIASLVSAARKNPFVKLTPPLLLLLVCSPANIMNTIGGQNGAFTAALFLGGLYLCEGSPVLGGVLLGLLTVKPHLGLFIPVALIMGRHWKCIASASVTAIALLVASWAVWGAAAWQDYIAGTMPFQLGFLQDASLSAKNALMPGPYADLVTVMQLNMHAAIAIWACIAFVSAYMCLRALLKDGLTPRSILMMLLATMLILPYGFEYDMVGLAAALAIYMATKAEMTVAEYLSLGALWALPAALIMIKLVPFPLSSVIMVAAMVTLYLSKSDNAPIAHFARAVSEPATSDAKA